MASIADDGGDGDGDGAAPFASQPQQHDQTLVAGEGSPVRCNKLAGESSENG